VRPSCFRYCCCSGTVGLLVGVSYCAPKPPLRGRGRGIGRRDGERLWPWNKEIKHRPAIFRQINKEVPSSHHDALEFPDGTVVLLTFLEEGQQATVLQLPVIHEGARVPEPEMAKVS
jgi:hypothetical protein